MYSKAYLPDRHTGLVVVQECDKSLTFKSDDYSVCPKILDRLISKVLRIPLCMMGEGFSTEATPLIPANSVLEGINRLRGYRAWDNDAICYAGDRDFFTHAHTMFKDVCIYENPPFQFDAKTVDYGKL